MTTFDTTKTDNPIAGITGCSFFWNGTGDIWIDAVSITNL